MSRFVKALFQKCLFSTSNTNPEIKAGQETKEVIK
jgi:hypothetical protein